MNIAIKMDYFDCNLECGEGAERKKVQDKKRTQKNSKEVNRKPDRQKLKLNLFSPMETKAAVIY